VHAQFLGWIILRKFAMHSSQRCPRLLTLKYRLSLVNLHSLRR
jgi:hypothetical protein